MSYVNRVIIKREFLNIVWNKKFIILTFAAPFLIGAYIAVLSTLGFFVKVLGPEPVLKTYALVDSSGLIHSKYDSERHLHYSKLSGLQQEGVIEEWHRQSGIYIEHLESKERGLQQLFKDEVSALLLIPEGFPEHGAIKFLSKKTDDSQSEGAERSSDLQEFLKELIIRKEIPSSKVRAALFDKIPISAFSVSPEGTETPLAEGKKDFSQIVADLLENNSKYLFVGLMIITLMQSASRFSISMARERESKLLDLLLSSVYAEELVIGKTVAIVAACLLRLFIWLATVAVCVLAFLWSNQTAVQFEVPLLNVVLAFVITVLGMIFFGLFITSTSSGSANPEDALTQVAILKVVVVFAGYFFVIFYLPGASYTAWSICSLLPFITPFLIPIRLMDPSFSLFQGVFFTAYMLLFVTLAARFAGRALRLSVMTEGQQIKLLARLKMLFGPQTNA